MRFMKRWPTLAVLTEHQKILKSLPCGIQNVAAKRDDKTDFET
jgi:hypothetical protein